MPLLRCRGFTMEFEQGKMQGDTWTSMRMIGSPWGDACVDLVPGPWAVKASTPHQACKMSKEMLDGLLEVCARGLKSKGFAGARGRRRRGRRR